MKINILFIAALTALAASVSVNDLSTDLMDNKDQDDAAYISVVRRDLIKPDPELKCTGNCRKYCKSTVTFDVSKDGDVQIQQCIVQCLHNYEEIFDVKIKTDCSIDVEGTSKRMPDPYKTDTVNCSDLCYSMGYGDKKEALAGKDSNDKKVKYVDEKEILIAECVEECLLNFTDYFHQIDYGTCTLF